MAFSGFDAEFFKFFLELRENNDREWFADNKARYESRVVATLLDFIEEMHDPLEQLSSHFLAVPKKTGGSMFRIYRDVRYAKDKRPYKEHAAIQFRHALGRDAHAPGFYLHLEPGNIRYGGGIWTPAADPLKQIREAIADEGNGWGRVRNSRKMKELFGDLRGDSLKRPPRGYSADHPFIDDLKRKSFFVMHPSSEQVAGQSSFVDEVAKTYKAAAPFMRFLCKAIDVPY